MNGSKAMKIRVIFIFAAMALVWSSAMAADPELSMDHPIHVPDKYAYGRDMEAFAGSEQISRYLGSYERGWWRAMHDFVDTSGAKHWDKSFPFICSGWPSEMDGCDDGYSAASKWLDAAVAKVGTEQTVAFVKDRLSPSGPIP